MTTKLVLKELSRYKIGTFADIIYRNALLYPDKEAFICGAERVTFSEFNARVNSLIHALDSMGAQKGDVLGVLSWNCLGYVDVYGAAGKGGFIVSPFNHRLSAGELEYLINYSQTSTLFVGSELVEIVNSLRQRLPNVKNFVSFEGSVSGMMYHHDLLASSPKEEPDIQVEEDDPVDIFYTSGTTGTPRAALYSHRRRLDSIKTSAIAMAVEPEDKQVMIMPLFHIGGATQLWILFYIGGSNVILKSFDPAATLRAIQEVKATDLNIVPTHLISILAQPDLDRYDLSSLKRIYYVGSAMPVEVLKRAMKLWGNIFVQAYGQSESGPAISYLGKEAHRVLDKPLEEQGVLSSCGQPNIGVHVRIVDDNGNDVQPFEVGEIITQSQHLMLEYLHKPDDTRAAIVDGWLNTGDMAYYDEKGYIYIVDRKQDMIVSGGENIYPREVEEILYRHPAVQEVAVISIPDPVWVERVHAVVVLKQGASLTASELIDFCKNNMARYKAPKSVEFVDVLPKSSAGKILKRELKEKYRTVAREKKT